MPKEPRDDSDQILDLREQLESLKSRFEGLVECFNRHDHSYYRADVEDWHTTDTTDDKFWN